MKHWFNERVIFWTFAGLFISAFVLLSVLLIISPKVDLENRGFISCSNHFIDDIDICSKKTNKYRMIICGFESVTDNTICDFKIVGEGFSQWISGNQKTPWSNYIFVPKLPETNNYMFDDISDEIDPDFEKLLIKHKELNLSLKDIKENDSEIIPESDLFDINKFKEIKKSKK